MQNLVKSIAIVTLGLVGLGLSGCKEGGGGVPAADAVPTDDMSKRSYAIGRNVATGLRDGGIDVDLAYFNAGFYDVQNDLQRMTDEEVASELVKLSGEMAARQQIKQAEEQAAQAVEAEAALVVANEFLAANSANADVVTLESGLQYKVLTAADGPKPAVTDKVSVNYEGRLTDGTVFDSSYERGQPASFPLNGVIAGWTEALQLMSPGAKWQLFIPPGLAYGERAAGQHIKPNSALIFDVELLSIGDPAGGAE